MESGFAAMGEKDYDRQTKFLVDESPKLDI